MHEIETFGSCDLDSASLLSIATAGRVGFSLLGRLRSISTQVLEAA